MTAEALAPLRGLGLPIVAPTWRGELQLERVEALPEEGYRMLWTTPQGSLTLYGASGGIGDHPPSAESTSFLHPFFGTVRLHLGENEMGTDWMSEMESGLPAYSLTARGLPADLVLAVARSLDYVKIP